MTFDEYSRSYRGNRLLLPAVYFDGTPQTLQRLKDLVAVAGYYTEHENWRDGRCIEILVRRLATPSGTVVVLPGAYIMYVETPGGYRQLTWASNTKEFSENYVEIIIEKETPEETMNRRAKYNDQKFESNITFDPNEKLTYDGVDQRAWVDRSSFAVFDGSQTSVDDLSKVLFKAGYTMFWQCVDLGKGELSTLSRIKIPKSPVGSGYDGFHWVYKNEIVLWDGALQIFKNREEFEKSFRVKDGLGHVTILVERDGKTSTIKFDTAAGVDIVQDYDRTRSYDGSPYRYLNDSPSVRIKDMIRQPDGKFYTFEQS